MQISINEASQYAKKKGQMYNLLANLYYLPDYNSKAITKEYLFQYVLSPLGIFVMKKEHVIHHHYAYRKYSSNELLEILEQLLKTKGKNPTGLTINTLPDQDWLRNAILHVDPDDPYFLLKKKVEEDEKYTIEVNEE